MGNLPTLTPLNPGTFEAMAKDAYVIDVRAVEAFCASHVPGSFAMALDRIPHFIGWFVPYDRPVLLVMDGASVSEVLPYLVRQGYDNVKGYLANGMRGWTRRGRPTESIHLLSPAELAEKSDDWWILDVRSEDELANGRIPGAHHIGLKHLHERLGEVPKDQGVIPYCGFGPRSMVAASVMQRAGCERVGLLHGGMMAWRMLGLPLR